MADNKDMRSLAEEAAKREAEAKLQSEAEKAAKKDDDEDSAPKYEYQGMSLRHEHVANDKLPKINVFYAPGNLARAEQVGYGIEEEGLPYRLREHETPFEEGQADIIKKGLGVALGLDGEVAYVYNRQLKKEEPFLNYTGNEPEQLRIIGKNGARIIKHKPFILED